MPCLEPKPGAFTRSTYRDGEVEARNEEVAIQPQWRERRSAMIARSTLSPSQSVAEQQGVTCWRQFDCFIGISAHITELKEFVSAQAAFSQPVLLTGEHGLDRKSTRLNSSHLGISYAV